MSHVDWEPERYSRFAAQRARPFWDLVGLVEPAPAGNPPHRFVDLGCGDGRLTAAAAERIGAAHTLGIDSSPAMLARAATLANEQLAFRSGDLATWTSDHDADIVLANASLHWVPEHATVLAHWADALADGGQLAVQVPANSDHPSHVVAEEVGCTEPFLGAMDGDPPPDPSRVNVRSPEDYAVVLHDLGFEYQHVRLQVYAHLLGSSADVVEWVRGSTLTRFFRRLPEELHVPFVDAYRAALLSRISEHTPYLYTFKRILMWGRRPV